MLFYEDLYGVFFSHFKKIMCNAAMFFIKQSFLDDDSKYS